MLKNRSVIFNSILFNIFLFIISGCVVDPTNNHLPTVIPHLIDDSWLVSDICSPPCWHGITPGISIKQDVINTTQKLPFISSNPPYERQRRNYDVKKGVYFDEDMLFFECKEPSGENCAVMYIKENLLTNITLYQTYSLSFEDVVERIGNPDGFTTSKTTPEAQGCNVSLFWNKKKIAIRHTEDWFIWYKEPFRKELCEIIKVADYKLPLHLTVQEVEIMDNYSWDFQTRGMHTWNGFINNK